mmetsp:Transcript_29485/g.60394  ORF Transcript_29485/g.60394 Transcript_29485/m.60394 type:complete len:206 (-) Transcript_29485:168-785(-)
MTIRPSIPPSASPPPPPPGSAVGSSPADQVCESGDCAVTSTFSRGIVVVRALTGSVKLNGCSWSNRSQLTRRREVLSLDSLRFDSDMFTLPTCTSPSQLSAVVGRICPDASYACAWAWAWACATACVWAILALAEMLAGCMAFSLTLKLDVDMSRAAMVRSRLCCHSSSKAASTSASSSNSSSSIGTVERMNSSSSSSSSKIPSL